VQVEVGQTQHELMV